MSIEEEIVYVVECPDGFNDFSILREHIKPGGKAEVPATKFMQMKRSQPSVVVVEQKVDPDSKLGKAMAEEAARREEDKAAIRAKYEKDAPPRRKKGSGGRSLGVGDTKRPVSPAELVNLPVTKADKDD